MSKYQVVGIGNAIVDVICPSDDAFLSRMGIDKGVMQLVERERGEFLYDSMTSHTKRPGGSVANTVAGLGALGLSTAFIGRVRADAPGRFYAEEMARDGTDFVNPPVAMKKADLPTSRSMIFVSPDGERSMNTYLGISAELGPDDVPDAVAGGAELLFLEGYLYDKPKGKAAFEAAARACRAAAARPASRSATRSASIATATISARWCASLTTSSATNTSGGRSTRPTTWARRWKPQRPKAA